MIIKQPNGKYAVFSSVVDDFILVDATIDELIEERVKEARTQIEREVRRVVSELEQGRKPYHQFTMTFDEAVDWITKQHGADAESLQMLRSI